MITFGTILEILFLGVALSMDASAVSIVYGSKNVPFQWKTLILPSLAFGLAQGIMPCIGYLGGTLVADFVAAVDHWIAFIILLIVGVKFILDSRKEDEQELTKLSFWPLMLAALATSIDACVVGITIKFAGDPLILSAVIIALITFIDCAICSKLGSKLGEKFGPKLLVVGGIVLIGIGTKILITDLFF